MSAAEAQIRAKLRMVAADAQSSDVLSAGERIAVALALDRYDLLRRLGKHARGHEPKASQRVLNTPGQ